MDATGRLRLDAIARFLQDAAIDDVDETGWGLPAHLWFVRCVAIDVPAPFLSDRAVEVTTWCSGVAAIAAGRRWSLIGDSGGRAEVDSVWIHLGPDQRPARIEDFGVYADATGGRHVSTRLELADPRADDTAAPWPLRTTDLDLHGHVNNAVYWQAVEHMLSPAGIDARRPLYAVCDYRRPIDADDSVALVRSAAGKRLELGFAVDGDVRAVVHVEQR